MHTLIYVFLEFKLLSYNTQRLEPGKLFRLLASLPTPTFPTLPGSPSPANKEDSGDSATPSCQILISRSLGWQELHSAYIFVLKVSCVIHRVISRIFSNRDYGVLIEEAGIALRGLFIIDPSGVLRFSCIEIIPHASSHLRFSPGKCQSTTCRWAEVWTKPFALSKLSSLWRNMERC